MFYEDEFSYNSVMIDKIYKTAYKSLKEVSKYKIAL